MEQIINKLSLFDLLAYILPGIVLLTFISSVFFNFAIPSTPAHIFLFFVLAFFIGNILHEFSFIPLQFLWSIYHTLKEKDSLGHGKKKPDSIKGRFADFIARKILLYGTSKDLKTYADELVTKKYEVSDTLGRYYIKEILFAANPEIKTQFEYLHAQEIFNKSMSVIFFFISVYSITSEFIHPYIISLPSDVKLAFSHMGLLVSIICFSLMVIFTRRYCFFSEYKKQIVNALVVKLNGGK